MSDGLSFILDKLFMALCQDHGGASVMDLSVGSLYAGPVETFVSTIEWDRNDFYVHLQGTLTSLVCIHLFSSCNI